MQNRFINGTPEKNNSHKEKRRLALFLHYLFLFNESAPIRKPEMNPKMCAEILMFGWMKVIISPMTAIVMMICEFSRDIKSFRKYATAAKKPNRPKMAPLEPTCV
ncbi:Uncharacterised protein [Mycobacteroides abscessus subsp. abscessus]|nr:Uncharacterised protein [Mycobacteroides abscessus subsp. abscessus]